MGKEKTCTSQADAKIKAYENSVRKLINQVSRQFEWQYFSGCLIEFREETDDAVYFDVTVTDMDTYHQPSFEVFVKKEDNSIWIGNYPDEDIPAKTASDHDWIDLICH